MSPIHCTARNLEAASITLGQLLMDASANAVAKTGYRADVPGNAVTSLKLKDEYTIDMSAIQI
jgi:hypothetical protein